MKRVAVGEIYFPTSITPGVLVGIVVILTRRFFPSGILKWLHELKSESTAQVEIDRRDSDGNRNTYRITIAFNPKDEHEVAQLVALLQKVFADGSAILTAVPVRTPRECCQMAKDRFLRITQPSQQSSGPTRAAWVIAARASVNGSTAKEAANEMLRKEGADLGRRRFVATTIVPAAEALLRKWAALPGSKDSKPVVTREMELSGDWIHQPHMVAGAQQHALFIEGTLPDNDRDTA
jgi:hypothetical protein